MGRWRLGPNSQVLAVHAALVRTGQAGRILYFGGDEHDHGQHERGAIDHSRIFDCASGAITNPGSPRFDTFCCGHAFLLDGRLLVAGGTEDFPPDAGGIHHHIHFAGLRDAALFDPVAASWSPAAPMLPEPGRTTGGGRWYPALTALPGGQVMAISGHPRDDDTRHSNDSPEAFQPGGATGAWVHLNPADPTHAMTDYPRVHLLPNGHVLVTNPVAGRTRAFKPTTGEWFDRAPAIADSFYHGFAGSSVLLPLTPANDYRPRILVCGGSRPYVLDLGAASPAWTERSTGRLAGRPIRRNCNATLLPNGKVLVTGGINSGDGFSPDSAAVLEAELFDPDSGSWTVLERATVPRNYHSTALLMPDGRVWTAGSNRNAEQSFPGPGIDNRELRIEIYEPTYMTAARPTIAVAPAEIPYGQTFFVQTPEAATIESVALLRPGASTHAFDMDQRHVGCAFRREEGRLVVTAPPTNRIAPPGHYMLFIVGRGGIPSVGRFIRLIMAPAAGNPVLIQGRFGRQRNFELIVGSAGTGLQHLFRNNDQHGLPWRGPRLFATSAGRIAAHAFIQGNFANNFEVVARAGDRLLTMWRDSGPDFNWSEPAPLVADGRAATGAAGNPALIQSRFGSRGNFELVTPLAAGGIGAYWRDNDAAGLPWHGPVAVGAGSGRYDAVTLIQSNFGSPGNLEVIARAGGRLRLFWRDSVAPFAWHGPFPIAVRGAEVSGAAGIPSLIQSRFGSRGNFELAVPLASGGIGVYWRDNDAAGLPWNGPVVIGASTGPFDAVSLIQSNYGSPGNLEIVGLARGRLFHFWRDSGPGLAWNGPFEIVPQS